MIETLRIAGLPIVDEALLEFGPSLNVLTGETGAGKSIVLSALTLLSGGKASARTLGEELSAALGGRDLRSAGLDPRPAVITLERDGELDEELHQPVPERRALLVRRRRIIALMVLTAALVAAIEIAVTVFLIPG